MSFADKYNMYNWNDVKSSIESKTTSDVVSALSSKRRTTEDFKALVSPAAEPFLEQMAQLSNKLTEKRFGKTIQLYVPLYLSNECSNSCVYCGFNSELRIERKTLTNDEILSEAKELKKSDFDNILIVSGENPLKAGVDFLVSSVNTLKPYFTTVSLEVQPLACEEYRRLGETGAYGVYLYQETYNKDKYSVLHRRGKKADFLNRLETPDRIGEAGLHKIGIGVLLGLDDWRADSFFCALHIDYLQRKYWKTRLSVSFPRIRPSNCNFIPDNIVTDRQLVQLICAYRIFNEDLELALSTREPEHFRNNIIGLGITTMSAGSKTNPGGYSLYPEQPEQFSVNDERSPQQFAELIKQKKYEPVWKDWHKSFFSI